MRDINEVRERVNEGVVRSARNDEFFACDVSNEDLTALLDDHARLSEELRKVNSGETVSVRFDLSPAAKEGAVRDQLVSMGWMPPSHLETMTPEDAVCPIMALAPDEYTYWEKRVWRRGVVDLELSGKIQQAVRDSQEDKAVQK